MTQTANHLAALTKSRLLLPSLSQFWMVARASAQTLAFISHSWDENEAIEEEHGTPTSSQTLPSVHMQRFVSSNLPACGCCGGTLLLQVVNTATTNRVLPLLLCLFDGNP